MDVLPPAIATLLADERLNELGPGSPNEAVRQQLAALSVDTAFTYPSPSLAKGGSASLSPSLAKGESASLSPSLAKGGPGRVLQDTNSANACIAALWLRHDFFDESHRISQEIDTVEGSYWHAILHRREPDAANAAYWFRRVGRHPIFDALAEAAQGVRLKRRSQRWDPFEFIELCEQHRGTGSSQELILRKVQQAEWRLLFDWCLARA